MQDQCGSNYQQKEAAIMADESTRVVTWEDTKAWIGRELGGGVSVDSVERSTIRRRLEVLELACPLHYDAAVARGLGYRDIIAPYTMLQTYAGSANWKPGDPTRWRSNHPNFTMRPQVEQGEIPMPGTHGFATDVEVEYLQPLCVGDQVSVKSRRLIEVNPKQTSVGDGAFLTWESRYHNQGDTLVAIVRASRYVYVPGPRREEGTRSAERSAAAGPPVSGAGTNIPEGGTDPRSDWGRQRYYEEAQVGDEVPAVAFPITIQRLVMEAGGNRDFNAIHHNREIARSNGAPDMFCNNFFLQGMWERAVREYIGLRGVIRKLGPFRMRIFNTAGDTVLVKGRVIRKEQRDGQNLVELEVWSENSKGVSVGPGPVLVALPSRGA
ncbi:MAG: MaoC family dehydratase N-terminal domain-containing protein [Chloroflexi bacterium]|nr:MaoC family dehydratase N-terminal domain-containing protein [Chloroflexota bacterium]